MSISVFPRKFLTFSIGEAASLFGDQFTRIAVIWLILSLTNDATAVGVWLAAGAFPRALFILVGGAMVDRFQPRTMMIASNLARMVLTAALAATAARNSISMPLLYGFAAAFGVAGAIYLPAITSLTPQLAPPDKLQKANSIVQGLMHLSNLVGPPLAALMLSFLLGGLRDEFAIFNDPSQLAYAVLFLVDAATFLISLWALLSIGGLDQNIQGDGAASVKNPLRLVSDGMAFTLENRKLRLFLLVTITANFGLVGPLAVGIPLIAKFTLSNDLIALGVLSSAGAIGGVIGLTLAALIPSLSERVLFSLPFVALPCLAVLLGSLGMANSLAGAFTIIMLLTVVAGFIDVQALTWIQKTTDRAYLGRVMSMLQFGALGITPLSMAIAGLVGNNLRVMFVGFGVVLFTTSLVMIGAVRRRIER